MVTIWLYVFAGQLVSAVVTIEVVQLSISQSEQVAVFYGTEMSLGNMPRGSYLEGNIIEMKECGQTDSEKEAILLVNQRKCGLEDVQNIAFRSRAKAVLIYGSKPEGKEKEKAMLGTVPIVGISEAAAVSLRRENTIVRIKITFEHQRSPYMALLVTLNFKRGFKRWESVESFEESAEEHVNLTSFEIFGEEKEMNITKHLSATKKLNIFDDFSDLLIYLCDILTECEKLMFYSSILDIRNRNFIESDVEDIIQFQSELLAQTYLFLISKTDMKRFGLCSPEVGATSFRYRGNLDKSSVERTICSISPDILPHCESILADTHGRALQSPSEQCNPGCDPAKLLNNACHSECDNEQCDYGNWACRCSKGCPPELQYNSHCDLPCNTTLCNFDNAKCLTLVSFSIPNITVSEINTEGNTKFHQDSCPICLTKYSFLSFSLNEGVIATLCRHLFHYNCLKTWLGLHSKCPM